MKKRRSKQPALNAMTYLLLAEKLLQSDHGKYDRIPELMKVVNYSEGHI